MLLSQFFSTGPDRTRYKVQDAAQKHPEHIEEYYNGRHLSAGEAAWV